MSRTMKVLVGYDGSTCADEALDDLSRAGIPDESHVMVLSVADLATPPAYDDFAFPADDWFPARMTEARTMSAELMAHAEALAHSASTRLQKAFPTWQVQAQVSADSPAAGLLHKAESWEADLIVVGSHGRSALGRLILGSVSQTVVTEGHTSVRVARARHPEREGPLSILIGYDGSAQADLAVRAVADRTWPAETTIRLVAAVDPVLVTAIASAEPALRMESAAFRDVRTGIERSLEGALETIRTRNPALEISTAYADGDPKHILLREAELWDADCIFVGARGRNRLQRLMLGSVSAAVTARAHCTVEVVRPAQWKAATQ